jgi:hypothetical protein
MISIVYIDMSDESLYNNWPGCYRKLEPYLRSIGIHEYEELQEWIIEQDGTSRVEDDVSYFDFDFEQDVVAFKLKFGV